MCLSPQKTQLSSNRCTLLHGKKLYACVLMIHILTAATRSCFALWTAELRLRQRFSPLLWLLTLFIEHCPGSLQSVILLSEIQMQESGKPSTFRMAKQSQYYRSVVPDVNTLYFQFGSRREAFKRGSVSSGEVQSQRRKCSKCRDYVFACERRVRYWERERVCHCPTEIT